MKPNLKLMLVLGAVMLISIPSLAQKTPPPMVGTYEALADAILGLREAESDFVLSILDHHFRAAERAMNAGDSELAAAQMALFANEGDNAVGGVRKRLIEGGHHHNAAGEEQGIYEEGYVIITRKAKRQALDASKAMREAKDDVARQAAWSSFQAVALELVYNQFKK